jgi:dolichol-phosphate mannosyltransferase
MKLSIVIPASNEEGSVASTVRDLFIQLSDEAIEHEIVVVNDGSTDSTELILQKLLAEIPTLRSLRNPPPNGYGFAVRKGIESVSGDAVAVFMADGSDSSKDLVRFYRAMREQDVDCVFGTRFSKESEIFDYPLPKLILNRIANTIIRILFGLHYNDVTNAFKLYRREVLQGLEPLLSHHFNLTVELPLKAIVRGYSFAVVPNSWTNRKQGESKLKIKEMGSRYLFIILYCFIEKWLSRGDYRRGNLLHTERFKVSESASIHSRSTYQKASRK